MDNNNGDLGLKDSFMNNQFSSSMQLSNPTEQFVVTEWDPLMSLHPFDCSSVEMADQIQAIPCFVNGSSSQQIMDLSGVCDREFARDSNGKKRKDMSGCIGFDTGSPMNTTQGGAVKTKTDEKRQRSDHNPSSNARKLTAKQAKEQRQNADGGKEDYIHVRAKRGQATNSHSLAERVRREKISERMRFLQNLVPGCNKITGKALMLDEIINYVQSLQRQVEFLSMKLAAVNPEMNFDILQLLTKDMLNSRAGCSTTLAFAPGMSSSIRQSNPFATQPNIQPEMLFHKVSNPQGIMSSSYSQINQIAHTSSWNDELHSALQMGFIPPMPAGTTDAEPPGHHGEPKLQSL